jgi:putative oxidoreductase
MNASASTSVRYWQDLTAALRHLQPLVLLLFRLLVAAAFWRAGVVKLADPSGTLALFSGEYHVPLLSPQVAAAVGTWVELITPWFLAFGLATRAIAAMLFVYNIIAVVSYPDLWPDGFWSGLIGSDFDDHKAWGLMFLALVIWGPGALSLDGLGSWWLRRRGWQLV